MALHLTGSIDISNNITSTHFSGSFSGSFQGDGSTLSGVSVTPYSSSYMTNSQNAESRVVYVFSDTVTLRTLTLPSSPITGSSVKVSNRSGLTTNIIARNSQNIMGTASDLTLDTTAAAFEMVFVGGTQGWVIIGAGS